MDSLIPDGYQRVTEGLVYAGDKYWDLIAKAWVPVTVNQHSSVENYVAVIRKEPLA